jgi:hypothetical protein
MPRSRKTSSRFAVKKPALKPRVRVARVSRLKVAKVLATLEAHTPPPPQSPEPCPPPSSPVYVRVAPEESRQYSPTSPPFYRNDDDASEQWSDVTPYSPTPVSLVDPPTTLAECMLYGTATPTTQEQQQ